MSGLDEDFQLTITDTPIEELTIPLTIGEEGIAKFTTRMISGFLDCVRFQMEENEANQYEFQLKNSDYDEVYIKASDLRKSDKWYPRIQPDFMDTANKGIQKSTFGVERKYLNESLSIQVRGTQHTNVSVLIRILKRE